MFGKNYESNIQSIGKFVSICEENIEALPEDEQGILKNIISKKRLEIDFLNSLYHEDDTKLIDPFNCLMKIEPVCFEDSIEVFGCSIKTKALNKISICFAEINKEDNSFAPSNSLIEFLMTDKALTEAIMYGNRMEGKPCTLTSALGDSTAPLSKKDSIVSKYDNIVDHTIEELNDRLMTVLEISNNILEKSGPVTQKDKDALAMALKTAKSHFKSNITYVLDTMVECLEEESVTVKSEVTSYITSINRQTQQLLENFNETKKLEYNPIIDSLNNGYSPNEMSVIANVMRVALNNLKKSHNIDIDDDYNYKTFLDYNNKSKMSKPDCSFAEYLSTTILSNTNEYILAEKAAPKQESEASLSLSKVTGSVDKLFGSKYSYATEFIELEVSSASLSGRKNSGKENLRSLTPIVKIAMTTGSFMEAYRGNVQNEYVPCSLTRLRNMGLDHSDYIPEEKLEINDLTADIKEKSKTFDSAINKVIDFLDQSISKKSDKAILMNLITEFSDAYSEALPLAKNDISLSKDVLINNYKDGLQTFLEKVSSSSLLGNEGKKEIVKLLR